ncbi:MAG: DUF488 family protein [Methanobacterium sp.]|nr:DUF488 family protein [Methanobacterium sp.]
MIKIKRAYRPAEEADGFRILVDRLWPRGISKEKAMIDLWLKDIAPSNDLRKWFSHNVERWSEFKTRYLEELKTKRTLMEHIKNLEKEKGTLTLIYAAKDEEHNNALVLKDKLRDLKP